MAAATMKQIKDYFGLSSKEMADAWRMMTDKDKADLKNGLGDGSLTY